MMDVYATTSHWAKERGLKLWQALETTSTNTIAKNDEAAETRPVLSAPDFISKPSIYLAHRQTGGRGRGTHSWSTPESGSLLSSWSYSLPKVPQPIFSALVGLALFEACRKTWPQVAFNIKAPNDLFIGDKKTAGILIETIDQGHLKTTIVGVGLNVSTKPADVPTATCLDDNVEEKVEPKIWWAFLDHWRTALDQAVTDGLSEKLKLETCERLKAALNLHPLLKEPILKVDEQGQLHSASRIIYWHEL